jgi:hypothetical protein
LARTCVLTVGGVFLPAGCSEAQDRAAGFGITARMPVDRAPGSVAVADLDRDGHLDIVVASEQRHTLTVLLGDGTGRFTAAPGSPVPSGRMPNDIALADFDRDGAPDLAAANHEADYVTVLLGDRRGGFRPAPGSPVPVQVRPHPHGVAAADFNGDGSPDLVVDSRESDEVEVLLGDGRGGFAPHRRLRVGRHPYQRVRTWDVNGDRAADIVTTNLRGADVSVLFGDGLGAFRNAPGSPFECHPFPTAVALGDLDGDGRPDLAVTNSPSNSGGSGEDGLTILLGDDAGGFRRVGTMPSPTGAAPTQLAIADFDRDDRDDIAVSNMNSGTVTIARLDRDGNIRIAETIPVGGMPKGIAVGDLNGDGRIDIVVADNRDDDIALILGR